MVGITVTGSMDVLAGKQESNNSYVYIYVSWARPSPGGYFPQHMWLAYPLPLTRFLGTTMVTSKPLEKRANHFSARLVLRAVAADRGCPPPLRAGLLSSSTEVQKRVGCSGADFSSASSRVPLCPFQKSGIALPCDFRSLGED